MGLASFAVALLLLPAHCKVCVCVVRFAAAWIPGGDSINEFIDAPPAASFIFGGRQSNQ